MIPSKKESGDYHVAYCAVLALAYINLAMWSYNLFVFLLLCVLPLYFDKNKTPPVDMAYALVPIAKPKQEGRGA